MQKILFQKLKNIFNLLRLDSNSKFKKILELLLILLVFTLLTSIAFSRPFNNISTDIEQGDAMFNAWTVSRNINCILGNNCSNYTQANIFFPNKDSMLFSETQISTSILLIPIFLINNNPILLYNLFSILTVILSGVFMYYLVKYLTNNRAMSFLGGLYFAFLPYKMNGFTHLQNASIFYLPLIILFLLKTINEKKKINYVILFILLVIQFYASWYQMAFVLLTVILISILLFILKSKNLTFKKLLLILGILFLAVISTLPVAKEFLRFAKESNTAFNLNAMAFFAADFKDYLLPYNITILGKVFYDTTNIPRIVNSSDSNTFPGFLPYLVLFSTLLVLIIRLLLKYFRNSLTQIFNNIQFEKLKLSLSLLITGIIGFIFSLGPILKFGNKNFAGLLESQEKAYVILPYILVPLLFPQLSFIRAVSRYNIIFSFAIIILTSIILSYIVKKLSLKVKHIYVIIFTVIILIIGFLDIFPVNFSWSFLKTIRIPTIYNYIKDTKSVNNIIELPGSYEKGFLQVLYAGYHNKNIYNGYSGISPKGYEEKIIDYNQLDIEDINELKSININFVLIPDDKIIEVLGFDTIDHLVIEKKESDFTLYKII